MTELNVAMPPEDVSVGLRLRDARESAGLGLADIAARTRVNARHLQAIEAGDFTSLPAAPYSVGFVKAYAREVGLDGAQLSAEFRRERDGAVATFADDTQRYELSQPGRLPGKALAWTTAVIALLILVSYGAWRSGTLAGRSVDDNARIAAGTVSADPATPAPTVARPAAPAAAPLPASGAVVLTATEPAWIKVYERDGATLFQGELKQGQTYQVPAEARDPLIRLGRAEVVKVTVGGQAVAMLGTPGRTVKDVSVDGKALLGRPGPPIATAPAA